MILKDIITRIQERIHPGAAEDFDNVGLLCGNPEREITGILVCHDALEDVVQEAVDKGANLIVCFHPIIFSGLKSITGKNYVERTVLSAIEAKVAIYAIHTAFDNDYYGVNYRIAEAIGLQKHGVLMPKRGSLQQLTVYVPTGYSRQVEQTAFAAGAGSIGFYDQCSFAVSGQGGFRPLPGSRPFLGAEGQREQAPEDMLSFIFESYKGDKILQAVKAAHPYEEVAYQIYSLENRNSYQGLGRIGTLPSAMPESVFLNLIKQKFNLNTIRHSKFNGKNIQTVAVLGGSGASGISAALAAGCDAYLTGDLKYHDFYLAEGRMLLCDIGHYESEQFVTQQIVEILSEKFPKFAVLKSETDTNPVNYFS